MTPETWRRVKAVALEAWELPAADRTSFVALASAGDEELQREVRSLLASMEAADESGELAGADRAAPDLSGKRLGAYELLSPIGAGGMGEVYKARDTRLDRIVAIKVLPGAIRWSPLSGERMVREARVVAALNHPNICTLHDVGSEDGLDFFVMEYVDGETLAACLSCGPLPLPEALTYAAQIASALAEAHHAGIVHRDVKPANIMLCQAAAWSGDAPRQAKLLDFGIAKAGARTGRPIAAGPHLRSGPGLTRAGVVVGTAPYMAPEQIDGHAVDARTDVFAFGAVLFEMLTGRKAFDADERSLVLEAVRTGAVPPPSTISPRVTAALDRIVATCLAKDPGQRYQTMDAVLEDLRAEHRRVNRRASRYGMAAALVLILAAGAAWIAWPRGPAPPLEPVITRLAASVGVMGAPALSPDGSTLVFSWAGDDIDNPELMVLPVGSPARRRLTTNPEVEEWPAWSPDGKQVAFIRCGESRCGIYVIAIEGGPERRLRELKSDRYNGLAWSPDGRSIVFGERAAASEPYALFLHSLETSQRRQLTAPAGTGDFRFASSPDGTQLAVIRLERDGMGVFLVDVATGAQTPLIQRQQEWFGWVTWSRDGRHLLLSANQQGVRRLWRLPVSGGALQPVAVAGEDSFYPSVSARGDVLVFVHSFRDWDFARASLADGTLQPVSSFPSSTRVELDPAFSPDGRKLAFVSERGGTRELWVSNADGTGAAQLTSLNGVQAGRPSWSPNGAMVAFHGGGIQIVPATGGAQIKLANEGELPTWSADGRWIYFTRHLGGKSVGWKVPPQGGAPAEAISTDTSAIRESPDGTLYFSSLRGIWRRDPSGQPDVPVVPGFSSALLGYWAVTRKGIYFVQREQLQDRTAVHRLGFFDFATSHTQMLGALTGNIEDYAGGMTISPDGRTVIYSHRTYETSEIVVVEPFR